MSKRTSAPFADPSSVSANASLAVGLGVDATGQSAANRPKPLAELWHPWVTRCWPATAREEAAFTAGLRSLSGHPSGHAGRPSAPMVRDRDFDRRDITALVTALRCGLDLEGLLDRARGLRPNRLLAAHTHLEAARAASEAAWQSIVTMPTSGALAHFGPAAATLLPVIVGHLEAIERRTPHDLERGIRTADAEISRTTQSVVLLEERLDACTEPSERGRAIGSLLFDAHGDGAWSLGTYLALRVGALVPLRVASLLGEDAPGQLRKVG